MNFKKLLYTDMGKILISLILGIGLASLFQKVCNDKECLLFSGPVIQEVDGKTFEYNDNFYKYDVSPVTCDDSKRIIETSDFIPVHTTPSLFQTAKSIWSPAPTTVEVPSTKI
jgi:hypothetical protein